MAVNTVSYDLHWLDYIIFASVLVITSGIGIFFAFRGGRQQTTREYFSGNRNLGVFPASLSIVVTFMSAVMIIGVPAEVYLYGGQYFLACIGTGIGTMIATFFIVPIFYPMRLVSNNKYLERRFNSTLVKYMGSFQSTLIGIGTKSAVGGDIFKVHNAYFYSRFPSQTVGYAAVVIYAPCTAIATLSEIPVWAVILLSSLIAIFYTSIGGIKAVIWTDTFLCFCMIAGMLMVSIQGITYAGGISAAWELSLNGGRLDVFNFDPDPAARLTVWNLLFAVAFDSLATYGCSQSVLMRYSNVETQTKAKLTVFLSYIGNLFMYLLPVIAGLSIYAYYAKIGCDPIASGIVNGPNELVTHFVMETLNYPGIPGIFLASISAAALSSVSSSLNSTAANLWDDFFKHKLPASAVARGALISKIIVILLGILSTVICFLAAFFSGTVFQLAYSIAGVILVPLNGSFYLGLFCPWINDKGVIIGAIVGGSMTFWICMGQFFTETYSSFILPTDTSNCSEAFINHTLLSTTTSYTPLDTVWQNNSTTQFYQEDSDSGFFKWMYSISYLWYRTFGTCIMLIVGTIVSFITGRNKVSETSSSLLCQCYRPCSLSDKELQHSESWTQDEFYSVQKKNPGEDQSML